SLRCRADDEHRVENALNDLGALSVTLMDADAATPNERAVLEPGVGEMPLWPEITMIALFPGDTMAELVLLGLVNGFGSEATAAYGAVNQIMGYTQFTAMSISISVSILGAQAIGGGHAGRLDAIIRTGLVLNLVLTGGLVALIYLFPRAFLGIFITDAAVLDLARGLLYVALWSSVPFGMAAVFSGAMRAGGVALAPMLLSISAIAAIEIPAAVVLSRIIGLQGVWAAYPIVFCTMFLLQTGYYLLVWRRRPLQRLL
ncbi:MAG: MATE family efflux transporter, partial [bacterium]|nr:MATE family efflux transporter [bacterium]